MPSSPLSSSLRDRLLAAVAFVGAVVAVAAAAVVPAQAADGGVVINEIESDSADAIDWIELVNTSAAPVDISGWVVKDDDDSRTDAIPAGTTLAPGGYYVYAQPTMSYGLGKADSARLFLDDGTTLVDAYSWTQHAATTYGRCADGTGAFVATAGPTPGAANACATPSPSPTGTGTASPTPTPTTSTALPAAGALVVNEVESNGDDTDWFELYNTTDAAIDVSGYVVRDNDDTERYDLPAGSVVPARGILIVDQLTAHSPGFDFGLGNADQVRLFAPDGTTLIAEASWTVHAKDTTYGLCPDGVGELRLTTASTKGAPNDCSVPVRINEVESSGGTPGDWIELVNRSVSQVAVGGLVVTDSDVAGHRFTIPAGTTIAAGGRLVLEEADFGFGLGGADAVHLFDTDGVTELDATSWQAHAATTWGRCADGTGDFAVTAAPTKGAANRCAGQIDVESWPGGADVRVLDDEATFGGDLSGLDVADGVLWGVQNGEGLLYRLIGSDFAPAAGWEQGKKLRYRDGSGTVDAEGVTAVGTSVYVSSERNNDQGSVSRPSILRYDPAAPGGELLADAEWNLAADFPGLGANAGLEGITWVPDAWLVAQGFVDQRTAAPYAPATYAGHGDGLFLVGVEGTAKVYAYALQAGGTFARVATIDTPFALVADVQFDRDLLWVVCDEACNGRTATYEIDASGAFAPTHVYARPANAPDVANEGFAIGSTCADGVAQTFYADDADTDGFSLRSGTLACTMGGTPEEPEPSPSPTPTGTASPRPTVTAPGATAPAEQALTDAARGGLTAPGSVTAGGSITLMVPAGTPGEAVRVWLFSTPTDLGAATVTAARTVTVGIPASVPAGRHRIVVTDAAGEILGWAEITVAAAPASAALAATGGDGRTQGVLVIAGVVLLAAGLAFTRRARRV